MERIPNVGKERTSQERASQAIRIQERTVLEMKQGEGLWRKIGWAEGIRSKVASLL